MRLSYNRSAYEWILEILSILCVIASFVPLLFYNNLGDDIRIPIHYNSRGELDGWGGKGFLIAFALITLCFYVGLSLLGRYKKKFNFPHKLKTDSPNAPEILKIWRLLLLHIKVFSLLIFAYLTISSYLQAVNSQTAGINKYVMMALLFGLFISTVFFYIKLSEYRE